MGSFVGHVVPGTTFLFFGLWFAYGALRRYSLSARATAGASGGKGHSRYISTCSYTCSLCPSIPVEGLVKTFGCLIAMAGEFSTGFEEGKFVHWGNAQHMMMYFFFSLHGIVDLATHFHLLVLPHLDYLTYALSFFVESFLFFSHLHGKSPMEAQVHQLIASVAFLCGAAIMVEMSHKNNPIAALARAFFVILQGTWFFQMAFLLYPPFGDKWQEDEADTLVIVTCIFTLHLASALVLILIVGAVCHRWARSVSPTAAYHSLISYSHPDTLSKLDPAQVKPIIAGSDDEEA